jgi:hypothetical protein
VKIRRHQAAVWTCPGCGMVLVSCSLRGSGARPGWEGKPQEAGVPNEGAYMRLARIRERHRAVLCRRHAHQCPVCYEAPVCDIPTCTILVDLGFNRDGFPLGGYDVCDNCKGSADAGRLGL